MTSPDRPSNGAAVTHVPQECPGPAAELSSLHWHDLRAVHRGLPLSEVELAVVEPDTWTLGDHRDRQTLRGRPRRPAPTGKGQAGRAPSL